MFAFKKESHARELSSLAIPLIIQNIAGMLIGLVDQMFLGRISTEAYGAIGIVVSLTSLIAGILGNIAVAFNMDGSRAKGEKDEDKFNVCLVSSILLDVLLGAVYVAFVFCLGRMFFCKVYGLKGEGLEDAVSYALITSPYILLQLLIFTFNSYFKVTKDTKRIMFVSTVATILNVALDYIFIFGKLGLPALGVQGAAIASIFSVFINALMLFFFVKKDIHFVFARSREYWTMAKSLVKSSIPLAGSELLEGSVFVVAINAIISHMGMIEISSYLLVDNLIEIVLISMHMYGSAAMTLTSEMVGKKEFDRIKPLQNTGIAISMMIYIVLGALLVVFRSKSPMIISDEKELVEHASMLIVPLVLTNIFNPLQTVRKYVLQSLDEADYVLYSTAIVNLSVLAIVFVLYLFGLKLWSVYIGLFVNYSAVSLIYSLKFNRTISRMRVEAEVELAEGESLSKNEA